MAAKQVVLLPVWAVHTFQAANQKYGYADGNEHGEDTYVDREPMYDAMHMSNLIWMRYKVLPRIDRFGQNPIVGGLTMAE